MRDLSLLKCMSVEKACFDIVVYLLFQNYVPTVFENYTASFEIDKQRIELNMWDTSGKTICFLKHLNIRFTRHASGSQMRLFWD